MSGLPADQPLARHVVVFSGDGFEITNCVRNLDPATGEAEVYLRDENGRIRLMDGTPRVARVAGCTARLRSDAPPWAERMFAEKFG